MTRQRACIVLVVDGQLAVMKRWRPDAGHYALLPGGGVDPGESVEEAAAREAMEELGLEIRVARTLEVELFGDSVQTYLWCEQVGGTFGTGTGDEFTAERRARRGTYEPAFVAPAELAGIGMRPAWLADRLLEWLRGTTAG